jgi:hypothetical protein
MGLYWSENTLVGPQTLENEIALGKGKLTMGRVPPQELGDNLAMKTEARKPSQGDGV